MKHILLLVFALLYSVFLFAQDTTVVQSFLWSSNTRADTFDFPDNPGQNWRKIYMVYNMRCHNGSTGGCGEWDYSCNTFLTDPSRKDSTRQMFPEYVVSGFSGNTYAYATQPTFTYYQFLQHETQISSGTPQESFVGNGTENWSLSNGSAVRKTQMLFTAAELSAAGLSAGNIQGLNLDVSQTGSDIGFLKLRVKSTAKTALLPEDPDIQGFTEVFFNKASFGQSGPLTFLFYQPYYWDGASNLLVELSYTSANIAASPVVFANETGYNAVLNSDAPDYALRFGSGSYVQIPPAPLSGISNEITVAFWSYGDGSVLPVNSTIFEGFGPGNNRAINVHLPWSNGSVYWDCGGSGGNYDRIEKAANPADWSDQWNHWAFTKNVSTGVMNVYLNGVLWNSGTGKTIPIDIQSLVLGASHDLFLSYYGKIDEFQIWDKALDAATIATWMRKAISPTHPEYAHLVAYYRFNEGAGAQAMDSSPNATPADISLPNWLPARGEDLYKDFSSASLRPNTTFLQGSVTTSDQSIAVLDSVQNAQQRVSHYGVAGTDLVLLDVNYYYPAGPMNVIDAASDTVLSQINAPADGLLNIQNLSYYDKRPARFELLSLVTPYGNGLNLGSTGKTFTFDVTDYSPILHGKKFLSVEYGGQNQEDLDIKFVFVAGTPTKPVVDIQNIWPEGRGYFQEIQDDRYFEPRVVHLSPAAQQFKLRSAVTGHGQNGEFVPRQHYLNVDGGSQEFQYDVWKYCGKNPIYPQGGTWVFDRAGWCPGMATDVHEFKLNAQSGTNVTLDYGINGDFLSDANYLVSNQLVSYGAYTHSLDVSVETIKRPNNQQVEYARINPACNAPLIVVRNNGSQAVTSVKIHFEVPGGGSDTYTWTGNLQADAQTEISLPVLSPAFFNTSQTLKIFQVQILQVNNQTDEDAGNNLASSRFTPAPVYNYPSPLRLRTTTNNNGADYSYTIKDASGNIVLSRDQMLSNTAYTDIIDLPNGCYTLNFEDTSNDGLSFWFFPEFGSGSLNLSRLLNNNLVPVKTFNPDFGGGVQFDFTIGQLVGTENPEHASLISLYPNPAGDNVTLEMRGFSAEKLEVTLSSPDGRILRNMSTQVSDPDQFTQQISLEGLPAGMYFVRVTNGKAVWASAVVRE